MACPFWCRNGLYFGKEKTLEGKRKKPLSLQGLMPFLFNSCLVQRKPNFDIGEIWCPQRQYLSWQISFSLPIKFSFSLYLYPPLPSPFPSFPKIRVNYDDISEDIQLVAPSSSFPLTSPFFPFEKEQENLRTSHFSRDLGDIKERRG